MSQKKSSRPVMGKIDGRDLLFWGLGGLVCIGLVSFWFSTMEQRWLPSFNLQTEYRKQPMLAAKRLAIQNGYQVIEKDHLALENKNDDLRGSMIIANNDGIMNQEQAQILMAWVAKGNTLITFPQVRYQEPPPTLVDKDSSKKEKKKSAEEELAEQVKPAREATKRRSDPTMRDPIAQFFGVYTIAVLPSPSQPVGSASAPISVDEADSEDEDEYEDETEPAGTSKENTSTAEAKVEQQPIPIEQEQPEGLQRRQSFVQVPGTQRGLVVTKPYYLMLGTKPQQVPLYQVNQGTSLRIYQHGQGKIVFLPQNIFGNYSLREYDNAQYLLDLLKLNQKGHHFVIVRSLKAVHWTDLAWSNFSYGILGMAALIALWVWRASRRFGSLLPIPALERRSLLEHIDASARWSWKNANGRQNLLEASRRVCFDTIKRRAPELMRLPQPELIEHLARQTGLDASSLANACFDTASPHPIYFTRQIQLLQRLRAHYER